jgi:hypothetical protein
LNPYTNKGREKKKKTILGSSEKVEIISVWASGTSFVNILSYLPDFYVLERRNLTVSL